MGLAVVRNELIIGSVLTFGTDRLTKWVLNRLPVEENKESLKGISVCLINLGIGFSTCYSFVPIPGIFYGITIQFVELWKAYRKLAENEKKLAELIKEEANSKKQLKEQQELIGQIEQAIRELEQQKQS